ncbi:MAG: VPLPA-CTERM sorting domain-containing protein [Rhodanobacter sp.]
MKKKLPMWITALGLMVVFSSASATMLKDTYQGGDGHGYGDVISGPGVSTYNVDGMSSTRSGSELTVTIYTNFAGNAGVESQWTRNHTGIGYGDLFLSTGWAPHGSGTYDTDNAANGNHWTYAFSLNNPLSNSGGTGTVYALGAGTAANHNPDVRLSDYYINCGSSCRYRNGQAVAVNKSLATATNTTGTWTVGDDFLSFSFDTAGLDLDPDSFGFHWTMYCGNDVIEGLDPVTVPEPAPAGVFLLGIGLIGLGVMRRRNAGRAVGSENGRS